ncbi:MAG: SGNH/GDSL hydrolase family protein, partial [Chloroflexota bacterium]
MNTETTQRHTTIITLAQIAASATATLTTSAQVAFLRVTPLSAGLLAISGLNVLVALLLIMIFSVPAAQRAIGQRPTALVIGGLILLIVAEHSLYLLLPPTMQEALRAGNGHLYTGGFVTAGLVVFSRKALYRSANLWLAAGSVVFSIIAVEVGLRVIISRTYSDFLDEFLFVPGESVFAGHHYSSYALNLAHPQIGEPGVRGDDVPLEKPDDVFRIVVVGGSTVYGTEVETAAEAFPAQLQVMLREVYGLSNIEVINGGVPGYNSWDSLANLQFRLMAMEPDIVVVYQNVNDIHARIVPPSTYRADNSGYRKIWNQNEVRQIQQDWQWYVPGVLWRIYASRSGRLSGNVALAGITTRDCVGLTANETCMGISPAEALAANPPRYYEHNLRRMAATARENDADVLYLTWASSDVHDDYA